MKKKTLLCFSLLLILTFSLTAQSAKKIDEILESENLSNGQACYLMGTLSGQFGDKTSFEEAFNQYKNLNIFKGDSVDTEIRLDEFADLILRNIKLKKSFCYMITKSPHYALRHLKRMNIIDSNKSASSPVKTLDALNIVSQISNQYEAESKETMENLEESQDKADEKANEKVDKGV